MRNLFCAAGLAAIFTSSAFAGQAPVTRIFLHGRLSAVDFARHHIALAGLGGLEFGWQDYARGLDVSPNLDMSTIPPNAAVRVTLTRNPGNAYKVSAIDIR